MRSSVLVMVLVALVAACGSDVPDTTSADGRAELDTLSREAISWCADNPEAHGEAAADIGIRFVGDFVRASDQADGPGITGLEPPALAIPGSDREELRYQPQFESREDSDRACKAAFESR